MRITGKIPLTHFYYDIRFRKAIGEIISYNSTVYEIDMECAWSSITGHVLMFDIDTDNEGGCAKLHSRLMRMCMAFDLNGYLFKTDNGFHFITTNILDKEDIIKMFNFMYPMLDDKAFAFGIINDEWHLRLSKKPNGEPIRFIEHWIYGEPDTRNSRGHYDLLDDLHDIKIKNSLEPPKGKLIDTDFGFTTYPLWK